MLFKAPVRGLAMDILKTLGTLNSELCVCIYVDCCSMCFLLFPSSSFLGGEGGVGSRHCLLMQELTRYDARLETTRWSFEHDTYFFVLDETMDISTEVNISRETMELSPFCGASTLNSP